MGILSWFGRRKKPPGGFPSWDAAIEATQEARREAIGWLGPLDPDVRLRGLLPSFVRSEPRWPATALPSIYSMQRFGRTLLFTNGLSDPFDPGLHEAKPAPESGHACELWIEFVGSLSYATGDELEVAQHWSEHVLWQVADWEAESRALHALTSAGDAVIRLIEPCDELAGFTLPSGQIAALVGQPTPTVPPTIDLPLSQPALLAIQLLTPAEHAFALDHGKMGANLVAERLAAEGIHNVVMPDRPSVVGA